MFLIYILIWYNILYEYSVGVLLCVSDYFIKWALNCTMN